MAGRETGTATRGQEEIHAGREPVQTGREDGVQHLEEKLDQLMAFMQGSYGEISGRLERVELTSADRVTTRNLGEGDFNGGVGGMGGSRGAQGPYLLRLWSKI